jgi:hypothetical protein
VLVDERRDEVAELPLRECPVDVLVIRALVAVVRRRVVQGAVDLGVEDDAARRGDDELVLPEVLDRLLEPDLLRLDRELDLLLGAEAGRPRVRASRRRPRPDPCPST